METLIGCDICTIIDGYHHVSRVSAVIGKGDKAIALLDSGCRVLLARCIILQ
jgi:hypothetical protein